MSRRSLPIGFLPSSRVWEASPPLSNTTMCVISKFSSAIVTASSQQSEDVKDKLDELIPWVTKLREGLAKADPNQDQQEVERRTELTRLALNQRPPAP